MDRYFWRTLIQGRGRTALSVGGVALALILIIALDAVFLGTERQSTRYIDHAGADIIVSQAGVRTMHMAASTLPAGLANEVNDVSGVSSVTPILFASDIVDIGGTRASAYVIGLPPEAATGRAPMAGSGAALPNSGGAVIDEQLAADAGLDLGDTVTVLGRTFRIDGLSRGTAGLANSVVIIPLDDFAAARGGDRTVSYLFVGLAAGASTDAVAERIRTTLDGVTVQTREQFAMEERLLIRDMGTNVIAVMNVLGFAVGLAVIALTVYLAIVSRRSEFGMLKAVGAGNGQLYRLVILQALGSVGFGFATAIAITAGLSLLLPLVGSTVTLALGGGSLLRTLVASLVIAGLSALLPIRLIAGLDPAMVFRKG
jgi:putative ABC transport system permease protein